MAERKVSIREFVEWIILQIDPAVLSELMTAYGYTDDSVESVMNALETKPEFVNDLGVALGEAIKDKKLERQRVVGGYQQVDEDMTLDDWMNILSSGRMELATGLDSTGTTEAEKKKVDWAGLLGTVAGIAGAFFGFGSNNQNSQQQYQQPVQQSGSTTFIWIILGVVVVSVIAIFAITLSKKK